MWKIEIYILPCNDYSNLNYLQLLELDKNIKTIKEDDVFYIPNEFYEVVDINGLNAIEYLYGENSTDESLFLSELIMKEKHCDYSYNTLYSYCIESLKEIGFIPLGYIINHHEIIDYIISDKNTVLNIKRNYIKECSDYNDFESKAPLCYPELLFHNDAFLRIDQFGRLSDIIDELDRHLSVLNDFGKQVYENNSENDALRELHSRFSIICSGKGSNENVSYKKRYTYEGAIYDITCNPHTKLYDGNNDYRIYFCWGRKEISNNKIIIAHMGDHWY